MDAVAVRPCHRNGVGAVAGGGVRLEVAADVSRLDERRPEMVAAAGDSGRLDRRVAIAWLGALLLGLVVAAFLADKATVLGKAGLSKNPGAL